MKLLLDENLPKRLKMIFRNTKYTPFETWDGAERKTENF